MSLRYLTATEETNTQKGECIYEGKETLNIAGNGDTFLFPDGVGKIDNIIVNLIVSSGSGKIQYSNSSRDQVLSGSETWKNWDSGIVTNTTDDVFFPVTAIRQVNISGTTIMEIRAL